jgi:hypothetical protein
MGVTEQAIVLYLSIGEGSCRSPGRYRYGWELGELIARREKEREGEAEQYVYVPAGHCNRNRYVKGSATGHSGSFVI